ncbi:hypothetical protein [Dictyobacter formicarum]|uniref:Uncharacterized protein n=1 Tax=Dictyobacter formicarum TaxID=2778368 RepID=A0ABQ3VBN9_9CHLR|nr:hypothetical protein [Dictyobacter formicarum]GHO83317.1 hypothetical protein KSZ_13230 [Dictyobacter formicarum]
MTISCRICQATYAPSQEHHYLLQAPPMALESAFMSMCHFCFRCRRPACPQCWDNVHGVCGECCVEANLPFRAQAAPLQGVLFATTRQAQLRRKHATPVRLVCVKPGRFQGIASVDTAETLPLQRAIKAQLIPPTTHTTTNREKTQEEEEAWQIERLPMRAPQARFPTIPPSHHQAARLQKDATVRNYKKKLAIDEIATRPPRHRTTIALGRPEEQSPHKASDYTDKKTGFSLESLITIVLFILLLAILVLIVTSLFSSTANTTIEHFLHVNIRAELAYLWQLIRQIHP